MAAHSSHPPSSLPLKLYSNSNSLHLLYFSCKILCNICNFPLLFHSSTLLNSDCTSLTISSFIPLQTFSNLVISPLLIHLLFPLFLLLVTLPCPELTCVFQLSVSNVNCFCLRQHLKIQEPYTQANNYCSLCHTPKKSARHFCPIGIFCTGSMRSDEAPKHTHQTQGRQTHTARRDTFSSPMHIQTHTHTKKQQQESYFMQSTK